MVGQELEGPTLFLGGDVMLGRGIDQIQPDSVDPRLYEPWIRDAREYVSLAERASGRIPRGVPSAYVWGDAMAELRANRPVARIINLETSVTTSPDPWPHKQVLYRMHPANLASLRAAAIDVCGLANNHVLDWGRRGLEDTLEALDASGLGRAGAGTSLEAASAPARIPIEGGGRVLVFAAGAEDSGVPPEWAATAHRSGIFALHRADGSAAEPVVRVIERFREPGDLVVLSIHWGSNWSFDVCAEHRALAHALLDRGAVHVVHGHSSHHVKGIEVYRGYLVIYGAGDLITDYEGIGGREVFRGELGLLYFPTLDRETGRLRRLRLTPTRVRKMRLERARGDEVAWLERTLSREGERHRFGTRAVRAGDGRLELAWPDQDEEG